MRDAFWTRAAKPYRGQPVVLAVIGYLRGAGGSVPLVTLTQDLGLDSRALADALERLARDRLVQWTPTPPDMLCWIGPPAPAHILDAAGTATGSAAPRNARHNPKHRRAVLAAPFARRRSDE